MRLFLSSLIFQLVTLCVNSQSLNGKIIVYTQFERDIQDFKLVAFDDEKKVSFFLDSIKNNSITQISVKDSLDDRWILLKLESGNDSAAWAGRFYIKGDEVIKVYFTKFFDDVLVTGGENEFIYQHRFLYFDIPGSLLKGKEYNEKELRKSYSFIPRSGYIYGRYLEFERAVLNKIKDHPDKNYVLSLLYDQRQMLPLSLIDSSLYLFSSRIRSSSSWNKLKSYSEREKRIIEIGVSQELEFQDNSGKKIRLKDVLSKSEFTFVDFWASWCVPCIKQVPDLKELFVQINKSQMTFVSMAIDEKQMEDWTGAEKKQKFPWPSYWDSERQLGDYMDITFIPQGVIFDRNGKVVERFVSMDDLKAFLQKKNLIK